MFFLLIYVTPNSLIGLILSYFLMNIYIVWHGHKAVRNIFSRKQGSQNYQAIPNDLLLSRAKRCYFGYTTLVINT
jgi:hypothetical protein